MSSIVNLKAQGLVISPNQLEVPEGSMSEADNVVIRRDNVVESRRGFKLFGNAFGLTTDRAKQLLFYKTRLLRHFSNTLQYEADDNGTFNSFSGTISETQEGLRIKGIEVISNFYFTSSSGIKKISANTASDFTTSANYITNAGGVKAIDITGSPLIELGNQSGFLTQNSKVAYRIVWGIRDKNDNLILGAPSQRLEVINSLNTLLILDFLNLLKSLDQCNVPGSLITDANYVETFSPALELNATSTSIRNNLIALAAKIDNDIDYTEGSINVSTSQRNTVSSATLVFSSDMTTYLSPGDKFKCFAFLNTEFNTRTFTVTSIVTTTVTCTPDTDFTTFDASPVAENSGSLVKSFNYSSIAQPAVPSTPATNDELVAIQTYLSNIIIRLQTELFGVIPEFIQNAVITPLDVTTTANVSLNIKIPQDITSDYFYQVYRSSVVSAIGVQSLDDVATNDELQLVIEDFPTTDELAAKQVNLIDQTPDAFRGANLYTNPSTGEGILQANDVPPFAKDIALYQGYTFYANTKTRHRRTLNLLGVQGLTQDYNSGNVPKITITNGTITNTYSLVVGAREITSVSVPALETGASLNGKAFDFYSTFDKVAYQTFYNTGISSIPVGTTITVTTNDNHNLSNGDEINISNSNSTPSIDGNYAISNVTSNTFDITLDVATTVSGNYGLFSKNVVGKTTLRVDLSSGDNFSTIAQKTSDIISTLPQSFVSVVTSPGIFEITNTTEGAASNATDVNTGFTFSIIQDGVGENASLKQILISSLVSPAQAVDATARSITNVINAQSSESVYAYYISGATDVPGQILLESRILGDTPFYVVGSNALVGNSFEPSINPNTTPAGLITSITTGTNPVITTSAPHGLVNGNKVVLVDTNSTPSVDGLYTITNSTSTTFSITAPTTVTVAGTNGRLQNAVAATVSQNENRANRIYYSKNLQPEAVPIVNYFEVGPEDFEILRILPLRNSLFVFKEDGLYRVSGETAPFSQSLFDSSCILTAPDSLSTANNLLYCWTRLGVVTVSETGVSTISRPIDTKILEVGSAAYPNFKTVTWGVGYESDNSYIVWTNDAADDTVATVAYRYSNLTNTWTTYSKTNTCGIVKFNDDKLYLGAGNINKIEQERKSFSREDYADWEYGLDLAAGNYKGASLIFSSVENVSVGDVLTQEQTLNIYDFNSLLRKLDVDPQVAATTINSITTGINSTITTALPHNLVVGNTVKLINTNSVPTIDGSYVVLSVPSTTSFIVKPTNTVLVAGSAGTAKLMYFDSLKAVAGDNMRIKLTQLAAKMDTDPALLFNDYASRIGTKTGSLVSNAIGTPSVVTTSVNHQLLNTRLITIGGSTGGNPTINGTFVVGGAPQNTFGSTSTFELPITTITGATGGVYATLDQDYRDVVACFNILVTRLNLDDGASFNNYQKINDGEITTLEAVVLSINKVTKQVTLNLALDFIVGPMVLYKAISTAFTYSPITFQDPLNFKQVYQATLLFQNKAFTLATLEFRTDLLPEFIPTTFYGDGNGIFGIGTGPFGQGFFGGASNAAPFRTTLPRQCIRSRYLEPRYKHSVAREKYSIYGLTLTGNDMRSERAYR